MQFVNDMSSKRRTPPSIEECLGADGRYDTILSMVQEARQIQHSRVREARKSVEDFGDSSMVKRYPSDPCCTAMEHQSKLVSAALLN